MRIVHVIDYYQPKLGYQETFLAREQCKLGHEVRVVTMEGFFDTLKSELVHHCVYHTRDEAKADVFFYIESFYNRRRRHSALDYLSPEAYEQLFYQHEPTLA